MPISVIFLLWCTTDGVRERIVGQTNILIIIFSYDQMSKINQQTYLFNDNFKRMLNNNYSEWQNFHVNLFSSINFVCLCFWQNDQSSEEKVWICQSIQFLTVHFCLCQSIQLRCTLLFSPLLKTSFVSLPLIHFLLFQ